MRPLDGTGEAEPPESGLPLTDHAPPDASEEPAAAEAEETPGPRRGWLCCSSPCAQPGECGVPTRALVSPLTRSGGRPQAGSPQPRAGAQHGPRPPSAPCPELGRTPELSPRGLQNRILLCPRRHEDRRKFLSLFGTALGF